MCLGKGTEDLKRKLHALLLSLLSGSYNVFFFLLSLKNREIKHRKKHDDVSSQRAHSCTAPWNKTVICVFPVLKGVREPSGASPQTAEYAANLRREMRLSVRVSRRSQRTPE